VACDALVSPLECKINNFRNFKVFSKFLEEFKEEMRLDFESIFVPTKYSLNRKLSQDILEWYRGNVEGCINGAIRESVSGEEATAMNKSLIEHCPGKVVSDEMLSVLVEIHQRVEGRLDQRKFKIQDPNSFNYSSTEPEQEEAWQ
jgi:chromosome partitioning protein